MTSPTMSRDDAHEVILRVLRERWLKENGYKPEDMKKDTDGRYFVSVAKKICCHITVHSVEFLPEDVCRYYA